LPRCGITLVFHHGDSAPAEPIQQRARLVAEPFVDRNALAIDAHTPRWWLFAKALMGKLRLQLSVPDEQKDSRARPDHTLLQQQRESGTGKCAHFSAQLGGVNCVSHGECGTRTRTLTHGARRLEHHGVVQG
jgi:hypothetical protein